MYGLPRAIVSENGTQFISVMFTYFCKYLRVHTKFVDITHPRDNGKVESANKLILKALKKKLDDANGFG